MATKLCPGMVTAPDLAFSDNTTQGANLGDRIRSTDGREFVYAQVGATAWVPGKVYQGADVVANHQNMVCVTPFTVTGGQSISATLGGTASTLGQYANGYCFVNDGTGAGQTFFVKTNTAQSTTTGTVVITIEDPVITTLDTTSRISLMPNLYANTIIYPTTATNAVAGVALYPVAATDFGFLQTKGLIAVLNDAGTTVGLGVSPSTNTAGAVMTVAATTVQIGMAAQTGVTTKYNLVFLNI